MTKTLLEHTCDQCGEKRIQEKISLNYFDDPTVGWFHVSQIGKTSGCSGFAYNNLFCSIKCLYEWAWKQQEVKS